MYSRSLHILLTFIILPLYLFCQCGPATPTFSVNLNGNPAGTWLSPNVVRNDACCGQTGVVCVKFIITLDAAATGITFNIFSGAVPSGALYYQIGCGPPTALGTAICLSGPGPHILTFCKPGNNANVYQITSIPKPLAGADISINDGCTKILSASGFNPSTVTWNSIYPGAAGAYNNYLSCTSNCLTPNVVASGIAPAFVDYLVCGQPAAQCNFNIVCDTIRVFFNPTLTVSIIPINPTICFGQNTTTLTAIGSGGTLPYNYLWNNITTSQTINAGVGTYNVQLSDASGCPPVYNLVTISAFSVPIAANAGVNQIKCSQNPLAIINSTITGASGGIWSGGSGAFSPSNVSLSNLSYFPSIGELSNGFANLILTTTGNGTCPSKTDTIKITYLGFTAAVTSSVSNVSCFGGSNGAATIQLDDGIQPYTYLWNTSPTQTTSSISSLAIGVYSVTIQDGIGCTSQTTISINQPPILAINSVVSNVTCFGLNNGSITVNAVGGSSPYNYSWSISGQTNSSINNLIAGNYSASITDANGCVKTGSFNISQPLPLMFALTSANVSCFGGSDGSIATTISGGTAPYSFYWEPNAATTQNATGLPAGNYTVTVTDNFNCTVNSKATITQPNPLLATTSAISETCNYLNNGSASVSQTGGTAGYTYSWSPGGQTTATISQQASGTYSVKITDNKGCYTSAITTILEPPSLFIGFINQSNVSCFGGNDAIVQANASGGTPNYSYLWSPSGVANATMNNAAIGIYTLTVTDDNNCIATNTIVLGQPAELTINSTITNVSCNGGSNGSILLTPSGGTFPYTFYWSGGGQITSSISNQPVGTYFATITDANGCAKNYTYTITEPLPINITFTATNVSCFNGNDGSILSNVSGGTASYTFDWISNLSTSQNISSLNAGSYTLNVTDSFNCMASNTVLVTEPSLLVLSISHINETCNYLNNGSASAHANGGTANYSYTWSPGGQNTSNVSNLSSGTYTVAATDNKGCISTAIAIITEPLPLVIGFNNQMNVSCFGGNNASIEAIPSGGTPNYSYLWSPGNFTTSTLLNLSAATYSVLIKDNYNCELQSTVTISQPTAALSIIVTSNPVTCFGGFDGTAIATAIGGTPNYTYSWMPGAISNQSFTALSSGIYSVTATDINGCMVTNTIVVNEPLPLIAVSSSTNSTCGNSNGLASIIVSGGLGSYTYQWMPAGGTNSLTTGLTAGVYSVQITDANGCATMKYVNIDDSSGPLTSIFSTNNVSCYNGNDGSATASIIGGTAPITYTWFPTGGNSPSASGLSAGTYYIIVTDSNGCSSSAITSPDILQPPPITNIITITNVSCFGEATGAATISAFGGTPAFSYLWLPGNTSGPNCNNLSAGNYSVQITDINNCMNIATYSILQPTAAIDIIATSTNVNCFGGNNGVAISTSSGGTAPYLNNWLPGNMSGQTISNLIAGTYTSIVTDANNCTATNTVIVNQPSQIILTTTSINSNCNSNDGQALVTVIGGSGSYTYLWLPTGGTNVSALGLLSGNYTVQVYDSNGCPSTANQFVDNNVAPIVYILPTKSVSCYGGSNAIATASVSGGIGPFSYNWLPLGGNSSTATNLPAGSYTLYLTAANGCTATAISSIIEPAPLFSNITTTNVSCFNGANGSATVTAGGGAGGYTFNWSPSGATSNSIGGLSSGIYSVQITDVNNCVLTSTYSIIQPTLSLSASTNFTAVSCYGGSNGIAEVNAIGGTAPYSFVWIPMSSNNNSIAGLSFGTYSVNVTDFNNCTTFTTVVVTQPTQAISATVNSLPTSCFGGADGTATITPSGGTGNYSFQWTPIGGSSNFSNALVAGSYIVLVNDANNCQTNISFNITEPSIITGSLIPTNPACGLPNGSILSQVSGGTGPYTYSWSPINSNASVVSGLLPNTYSLNVTDNNGCIKTLTTNLINIPGPIVNLISTSNDSCFGSSDGTATINISQGTFPHTTNWLPYGGNLTTASQLSAGIYTAVVTDSRGCLNSITATINEPNPLAIIINTVVNVSCFNANNGSVSISANGGSPSYNYQWSTSATGPTINNLAPGFYTVTVTDSHYCTSVISMNVSQPAIITSSISAVTNPICYNGTGIASIAVNGGTAPFTYIWSTTPIQNGNTATNMQSGTYTVQIADANSCTNSNTVILTQPLQVTTIAGINDTICFQQSGSLSANATGGFGSYYYAWQPLGVINTGTLLVNPALTTTNYTVVAFDQNGCPGNPDIVSAIVYNLTSANIQAFALTPICPGQATTIYANATGNTGPLTYNWNNSLGSGPGAFTTFLSQPTTYIVTVTNSCGTSIQDSVRVLFNPPPNLNISTNGGNSCVPASVSFFDNSTSSNLYDPITNWFWDFGDGSNSINQNPSHTFSTVGTYSVYLTITTNGGCTNNNTSLPSIVNVYPYPTAIFSVNSMVLNLPYDVLVCTNQSVGAMQSNWNFGDGNSSALTNPTHNYSSVGFFEIDLVVTNEFGCSDTSKLKIMTEADVIFPNAFSPNLEGPSGGYYYPGSLDNDIFFPYTSGVIDFKFQIFNRWGELIFETEDIKQGWDGYYRGKICQVGVYVWKAYIKLNSGKIFNKTGDVTLLK